MINIIDIESDDQGDRPKSCALFVFFLIFRTCQYIFKFLFNLSHKPCVNKNLIHKSRQYHSGLVKSAIGNNGNITYLLIRKYLTFADQAACNTVT